MITEQNFRQVIKFIENNAGISLPDTSIRPVKGFIFERLSCLEKTPESYLEYIQTDKSEYDRFIDAVTINETYFFREKKHFKVLETIIFPEYANTKKNNPAFWSAACSTGEEAVSIAALAEKFWGTSGKNYSVFASDLNSYALEMFEKGEFGKKSFREDGSCFHHLLKPFFQYKDNIQTIENSLKQKIRICQLNLLHDNLNLLPAAFNIVFLRNALMYMPADIRQNILDKVVRKIADKGYLFLSSSETPLISHKDLRLTDIDGVFFFQKINGKKSGCISHRNCSKVLNGKQLIQTDATGLSSKREAKQHSVNIKKVSFFANQKLNNDFSYPKDDINHFIALQFREIVFLMNSNKFIEARKVLQTLDNLILSNEISLYFSGYLDMAEQNEEKAIRQFSKSLICNHSFWPARFYLGMLLQKSSPRKAHRQFELCRKDIVYYLKKNSCSYQFLLEDFNARYFLDICEKYINRLTRTGSF